MALVRRLPAVPSLHLQNGGVPQAKNQMAMPERKRPQLAQDPKKRYISILGYKVIASVGLVYR